MYSLMMETAKVVFGWIQDHPEAFVQLLVLVWAVLNVIWAQWPKPHSLPGQRVWKVIHGVFGLVATHATTRGTFTWPSLLRALVVGVLKLPAPDPFVDADGDGVPDYLS